MRSQRFQVVPILVFLLIAFTSASADLDLKVFDSQNKQRDLQSVVDRVSGARAVFVGENHDRYDQHLSELEIVRRLYEREPDRWVIGVEFIQKPFQRDLDAFITGAIDEREFLQRSQYFDRWGYDFRLYAPIFRFAKEHGIPMVALNAPEELTKKVAKVGLGGLTDSERAGLPAQFDKSDDGYRKRMQKIFKQHPESTGGNFDRFLEAQLVWDETMAEQAAAYLMAHPNKSMVVLAGRGHMEFGSGIPNRVRRRLPNIMTAVLITADKGETKDHSADYFLVSMKEVLPPAPKMGITMDGSDGVHVKDVTRGGPAADTGIKPKDRIVSIDGQNVKTLGDVRLVLFGKKAGDHLAICIRRADSTDEETFQIVLQ